MPSGITHILLTKKLQDEIVNQDLKNLLAFGSDFLAVGAVAPDLPYASIADDDFFLSSEKPLANAFHYEKTNQIPIKALLELKNLKGETDEKVFGKMVSFFLGYIAHVMADGIIHPYVRDKVGNYQGNESAHRSLEMKLDVLYLAEITKNSGNSVELNSANIQDELLNFTSAVGMTETMTLFGQLIYTVYGKKYSIKKLSGWAKGLHRLFNLASGHSFEFFRGYEGNTILFMDKKDIIPEEVLLLTKPVDVEKVPYNFLHRDLIHYYEDCIPRFFEKYVPVAQKAFDFLYGTGTSPDESDIPEIDLDTGRLAGITDLNIIPEFWKT